MFNTQHVLYMVISGILTVLLLVLARVYARDDKTKNRILKLSAIITVVIHYSNIWVNYFAAGGGALIENNHILPVYPCNVMMWLLLAASLLKDKKSLPFQLLSEFCFLVGSVCGIVGIAFNANFGNNPTLANYDILKGLLSHSTMLFGCLYMAVGGYVRLRVFNTVSVAAGLGVFVLCGVSVNRLHECFGLTPPDGMFLRSNPYFDASTVDLGILALAILFVALALWELRLPRQQRWYNKLAAKYHEAADAKIKESH